MTYFSTNNDVSIRLESRSHEMAREVYLEWRSRNTGRGFKMGMNNDYRLHIGYGSLGTADATPDAIRMDAGGNIAFLGPVQFKGKMIKKFSGGASFSRGSGLSCRGGGAVIGYRNRWSGWSRCPRGYQVVGIQSIHLLGNNHWYQDIDHYQCDHRGCRAWCRNNVHTSCRVVARCCRTPSAPLRCYSAGYRTQWRNRWGHPSYCHHRYAATGFANLDLHNNRFYMHQAVDDFYVGARYARSWCWGSNCGVRARCCRPRNWRQRLHCVAGGRAYGRRNRWGPWSRCPARYTAVSLMRVDMLDHVHRNHKNMAKYECNDAGCRTWGWGSEHNTWAKCCRVLGRRL